jgi:predicted membrane chloride channel (bestrophin family)
VNHWEEELSSYHRSILDSNDNHVCSLLCTCSCLLTTAIPLPYIHVT